jgi:hypothetical protein
VIEREAAVRAVEDQLERDYQQWRAAGVDALRMAVVDVEEHELVWIVSWTSERFVRTRNPEFMLAGNGPYLVDRVDGGLHRIGVVSAVTGEWEADYRARIRGLPVRTAVDDLHDALCEVAAARGRVHAVRTLRQRLPMFSPAEAIEYVSADNGMRAYSQSKIAFGLFGLELDRRSKAGGWGITSNLSHPGVAPTSLLAARPELGRAKDTLGVRLIRTLSARGVIVGTVHTAQLPALHAATSPEAKGGAFYGPSGPGHLGGPPAEQKPYTRLRGIEDAQRIWRMSEELVGVHS